MFIEIRKDDPTVPFHSHWQFCVGSPHAAYALRRDYFEQLKQVHQDLKIQRVRFHGIFCDDIHTYHKMSDFLPIPGGSDYTEQSFRWCGAAYDTVLTAGMSRSYSYQSGILQLQTTLGDNDISLIEISTDKT